MRFGKALGLGQGFVRDGGDQQPPARHGVVMGQFRDRVGRGAVQRRSDRGLARAVGAAEIGQIEISDLFVRDDQQDLRPARVKRDRALAQARHGRVEVGIVDGDLCDQGPPGAHPAQKTDAVERKREREIRYHGAVFSSPAGPEGVFIRTLSSLRQLFAEAKKDRTGPLVSGSEYGDLQEDFNFGALSCDISRYFWPWPARWPCRRTPLPKRRRP
ncbi:hypothetical protein JYP51_06485 [Ponticoccus gilvus]|nr:hypothetical protein [Enemella evansiae]